MNSLVKRTLALALAVAMPTPAFATNGMFMIGYGVKSVGMGGVAIAFAQDALVGATNPAASAQRRNLGRHCEVHWRQYARIW